MKIHIPQPISRESEMNLLIMPGLSRNEKVEFVHDGDSADFVFYHHSGEGDDFVNMEPRWEGKCIMIDYQDDPFKIMNGKWSHYFKRSVVDKSGPKPKGIEYGRDFPVTHLPYCVKEYDGMTGFHYPEMPKEYDVCCLFGLDCWYRNRNRVVNYIDGLRNEGMKVFTGLVDWHFLKRSMSDAYFETMRKSRIVVTCNPDEWEGDYRLFEALTTGSLVFCDEMHNKMGLEGHVVWYDLSDLESLKGNISHFLNSPYNLETAARNALEQTKKNHTSDSRVKFIIETISKK